LHALKLHNQRQLLPTCGGKDSATSDWTLPIRPVRAHT